MAYLLTLKLLVDATSEVAAADLIMAAVKTMKRQQGASTLAVVDASLEHSGPVIAELDDSIGNDTYKQGDAFRNWVIYSKSEDEADDEENAGYWSNEYGWVDYDQATRFDCTKGDLPVSAGNDATWFVDYGVAMGAAGRLATC